MAASHDDERKWSPPLDDAGVTYDLCDLVDAGENYNRLNSYEPLRKEVHWLTDKLLTVVLQRPEDEKPILKIKDLKLGKISDLSLPSRVFAVFPWTPGEFATLHSDQLNIWNAKNPANITLEKTFEIDLEKTAVLIWQVVMSPNRQQIVIQVHDQHRNIEWFVHDLNSRYKASIKDCETVRNLDATHLALYIIKEGKLQVKILELDSSSPSLIKSEELVNTEWLVDDVTASPNGRLLSISNKHQIKNIELYRNPNTGKFACTELSELDVSGVLAGYNNCYLYVNLTSKPGIAQTIRVNPVSGQKVPLSVCHFIQFVGPYFLRDIDTKGFVYQLDDVSDLMAFRSELADALPMQTMPVVDLIGEYAHRLYKPLLKKFTRAGDALKERDSLDEVHQFIAILDKEITRLEQKSAVVDEKNQDLPQARNDRKALQDLIDNHAVLIQNHIEGAQILNVAEIQRIHPDISDKVKSLFKRYMEDHLAIAYRESVSPSVTSTTRPKRTR